MNHAIISQHIHFVIVEVLAVTVGETAEAEPFQLENLVVQPSEIIELDTPPLHDEPNMDPELADYGGQQEQAQGLEKEHYSWQPGQTVLGTASAKLAARSWLRNCGGGGSVNSIPRGKGKKAKKHVPKRRATGTLAETDLPEAPSGTSSHSTRAWSRQGVPPLLAILLLGTWLLWQQWLAVVEKDGGEHSGVRTGREAHQQDDECLVEDRRTFQLADLDGIHYVTSRKVQKLFAFHLGERISSIVAKGYLHERDLDGDDIISEQEFLET